MNLLIVDDEVVQIETLKRGLRNAKYGVVEALNAQDAMERLKDPQNPVHMVLLDYAMPGKNGIELLKDIRRRDRLLPVIMMSAYAEKNMLIEALQCRCDGFIEKPFSLEQLTEEIERVRLR